MLCIFQLNLTFLSYLRNNSLFYSILIIFSLFAMFIFLSSISYLFQFFLLLLVYYSTHISIAYFHTTSTNVWKCLSAYFLMFNFSLQVFFCIVVKIMWSFMPAVELYQCSCLFTKVCIFNTSISIYKEYVLFIFFKIRFFKFLPTKCSFRTVINLLQ